MYFFGMEIIVCEERLDVIDKRPDCKFRLPFIVNQTVYCC
jgi:hypothetical protein